MDKLVVVGQGYVGLPLAVRAAEVGFIPPVGVVRATCDAAMVERRRPVGVRLMSLGRWYGGAARG